MKLKFSIKNFFFGILAGLFFSILAWGYTAYCNIAISQTKGIRGVCILSLAFGITAGIFGIDKLMDNIP